MGRRKNGVKRSGDSEKRRELLSKLKDKRASLKGFRSPGANPKMHQALRMTGKGVSANDEMLKDIQSETKGLKGKKAKKYMKNMISGMDNSQLDQFDADMKGKGSEMSEHVSNYVNQQKKINKEKEDVKPVVNTDTVYYPTKKNSIPVNVEKDKVRKRKTFSKLSISVPKITELSSIQSSDPSSKSLGLTTENNSTPQSSICVEELGLKGIDEIFAPTVVNPCEELVQDLSYAPYEARTLNLSKFKVDDLCVEYTEEMMMCGHDTKMIRISEVELLQQSPYLVIPKSGRVVTDVGSISGINSSSHVVKGNKCYILDRDNNIVESDNCINDCNEFIKEYSHVFEWVKSFTGKNVPVQWMLKKLNYIGLILNPECCSEKTMAFSLLGKEYEINSGSSSVPKVPAFVVKI